MSPAGSGDAGPAGAPFARLLFVTALAYALCHHVGALPGGLGTVGDTRWADWIDLLTPYLVLLPAAAALAAAAPSRRQWAVFAVGAVTYAEGKGLHVSSNSIGNVAPGDVVHLWDEVVGHLVWYSGAAVVMAVLATVMRREPPPRRPAVVVAAVALALAVGGTWVTNALGGGPVLGALAVAIGLAAYGLRHRRSLAVLLVPAFAPAAVALGVALAV